MTSITAKCPIEMNNLGGCVYSQSLKDVQSGGPLAKFRTFFSSSFNVCRNATRWLLKHIDEGYEMNKRMELAKDRIYQQNYYCIR